MIFGESIRNNIRLALHCCVIFSAFLYREEVMIMIKVDIAISIGHIATPTCTQGFKMIYVHKRFSYNSYTLHT